MVAGSNPVPRSKGCMEVWCVYGLRSELHGGFYVGMSSDVKKRVEYHNRGYNRSTRSRTPFELVYIEECSSRLEARKREKYLKSGMVREFLKARLAGKGWLRGRLRVGSVEPLI